MSLSPPEQREKKVKKPSHKVPAARTRGEGVGAGGCQPPKPSGAQQTPQPLQPSWSEMPLCQTGDGCLLQNRIHQAWRERTADRENVAYYLNPTFKDVSLNKISLAEPLLCTQSRGQISQRVQQRLQDTAWAGASGGGCFELRGFLKAQGKLFQSWSNSQCFNRGQITHF